jgi:hypothetical protein
MSERRPHWEDDLIEAVADMAWGVNPKNEGGYGRTYFEMTYDVIAAVEDWQSRNAIRLVSDLQGRLMQREATIQRVREFLDDKDGQLSDEDRAKGCTILVDIGSVRRALDGDA